MALLVDGSYLSVIGAVKVRVIDAQITVTCADGTDFAGAYAAVYDLVKRLRRKTGIDYDPHWYRHTYATRLLRGGTPVEVVSKLLGHACLTTTTDTYGHLTAEYARRVLESAGFLAGTEVRW